MKKVCIISLRGSIVYDGMGSCVPDSICEVVKRWVEDKEPKGKHEFSYHRVNLFGKKNPRRNLNAIKTANVLLFISYSEFTFHIKNRQGGWEYRRSWNDLLDMRNTIQQTHDDGKLKQVIWLFSSDNRDDTDLYENYVFPNCPIQIAMFDENLRSHYWEKNGYTRYDWFGNVHSLKVDWIRSRYNKLKSKPKREIDVVYWGSTKRRSVGGDMVEETLYRGYGDHKTDFRKFEISRGIESGDDRHHYLKAIRQDKEINSYYIGMFKGDGFSADKKWVDGCSELLTYLFKSKITICFNWHDDGKNITSRLYECLGSGVIPILVGNYWGDVSEDIGLENKDFYRANSVDECLGLIHSLKPLIN